MNLNFYKYQGAGNDFIMVDNRTAKFPKNNTQYIHKLCDRRFGIGADGLILLEKSTIENYKMVYFNADGNEGSMCGNGGRCFVAFAKQLGLINSEIVFDAVDGKHHATINDGIISLKMIDVTSIDNFQSHTFLDTGSPHHISFCKNVNDIDVKKRGSKIRFGSPYFEEGTNVNFAEQISDTLFKVRTYERGVENETLACGTGVTAVAIAAHNTSKTNANSINIEVLGGELNVSFKIKDNIYTNVYLTGPAKLVFEGNISV